MFHGTVVKRSTALTLGTVFAAAICCSAAPEKQPLQIRSVHVGSKTLSFHPGGELNLGTFPNNITIMFGRGPTERGHDFSRVRTKLEGYDRDWKEGGGEMYITMRFYNASDDVIGQKTFTDRGQSAGWTGSIEHSTMVHRRETFSPPTDSARLWAIVSSAGGPGTVGTLVVDNLKVSRISGSNKPPEVLLHSPFQEPVAVGINPANSPEGWTRDGTKPSMAKVVEIGPHGSKNALAVMDDDPMSHAEWHNTRECAAAVSPSDNLAVEWNEMFTIGSGDNRAAYYPSLPPGNYKFHVAEFSILGEPTGAEAVLSIRVPLPYWQSPWFWGAIAVLTVATSALSVRYLAWQKMRRAMVRLEQQRALEQERLRIARDIHDDLGARVTEISMLSAMAQTNAAFSDKAREEFYRITLQSRDLVTALYETVWAVNPENDNLEAVGNYLRQRINNQCTQAKLRCRLHVSHLPQDIETSSRVRHNISMATREAMHNIVKHARASQVTVHINFDGEILTVSLQDDGCGFDLASQPRGYGLTNMQRRLEEIGGSCSIESSPGTGTTVTFKLAIHSSPARTESPPSHATASQSVQS